MSYAINNPIYYKENQHPSLKQITPIHWNSLSTPGFLSLITAPYETVVYSKYVYESQRKRSDLADVSLKLAGAPPRFFYALSSSGSIIPYFGKLPISRVISSVGILSSNVLGILACVIEGIFQTVHIASKISFKKNLHVSWMEELKQISDEKDPIWQLERLGAFLKQDSTKKIFKEEQPKILNRFRSILARVELDPKNKDYLLPVLTDEIKQKFLINRLKIIQNKYFMPVIKSDQELLKKKLLSKKRSLADRISPIMVQKLEKKLPDILKKLESSNPKEVEKGIQEGEKILGDMNKQIVKAFVVHMVAIISLVLLSASLIALAISAPYLAPLILSILGTFFWIASYSLHKGLLNHTGLYLSVKNILPNYRGSAEKG